jgi:hypothetical protein
LRRLEDDKHGHRRRGGRRERLRGAEAVSGLRGRRPARPRGRWPRSM